MYVKPYNYIVKTNQLGSYKCTNKYRIVQVSVTINTEQMSGIVLALFPWEEKIKDVSRLLLLVRAGGAVLLVRVQYYYIRTNNHIVFLKK